MVSVLVERMELPCANCKTFGMNQLLTTVLLVKTASVLL